MNGADNMKDSISMVLKIDVEFLAYSYHEGLGAGKMLLSTNTKVG